MLPQIKVEEITPEEIELFDCYSDDAEECPQCGCINEPTETCGFIIHLRCQDCGWQYDRDTREVIR